jgi:Ca-activated chloride channel family protein
MGDGLEHALQAAQSTSQRSEPTPTPQSRTATPSTQQTQPDDQPVAVVLLSDGASSAGRTQPLQAADAARQLGVPVFTVALGTSEGTVRLPSGSRGQFRMLRVPPDERTLQQIAEVTGGRFFSAPSQEDLRTIYEDLGSRIGFVEEHQEVTAFFAAAALALMVAGGALGLTWFNRFP